MSLDIDAALRGECSKDLYGEWCPEHGMKCDYRYRAFEDLSELRRHEPRGSARLINVRVVVIAIFAMSLAVILGAAS